MKRSVPSSTSGRVFWWGWDMNTAARLRAAYAGDKMPTPKSATIVDKISPAVTPAEAHAQADERVETVILENVRQSAKDALTPSGVLQHFLHRREADALRGLQIRFGRRLPLGKITARTSRSA
jgi:hypothetical protein